MEGNAFPGLTVFSRALRMDQGCRGIAVREMGLSCSVVAVPDAFLQCNYHCITIFEA